MGLETTATRKEERNVLPTVFKTESDEMDDYLLNQQISNKRTANKHRHAALVKNVGLDEHLTTQPSITMKLLLDE